MDLELLNVEKKIILREFNRFKEFANLALNKLEAYDKIQTIFKLYNFI